MFDWDKIKNSILHADCMDIMKDIPDKYFNLALVDPPFGIKSYNKKIGDKPDKKYFDELFRISKDQIIWGGNYFNLPWSEGWLCWDKKFNEHIRNKKLSTSPINEDNISDFELAWTSILKKAKFIRYLYLGNLRGFNQNIKVNYDEQKKIHPVQRPIEFYRYQLQNYAKQDDKIIDTHSGSGSCAIACHLEKFDFLAIEKDYDYWKASVERYETEISQGKLF